MKKIKDKYRKIPGRDKLLYLFLILAVLAVISWRIDANILVVVGTSAGLLLSAHVILTYPKLLLTAVISLIHISLLPYVSLAYATLSIQQEFIFDYQSNFLILIGTTIILWILVARIKRSPWLILLVAYFALDILGLLIISFIFGKGYGAPIGSILAVLSLLLWYIPLKKKKTSIVHIPKQENLMLENSLKVSEEYLPFSHILLEKEHVFLICSLKGGKGIKFQKEELIYRHQKLDSFYAQMMKTSQEISKEQHIDIRLLVITIITDVMPDNRKLLSFAISHKEKIEGVVHITTSKDISLIPLSDILISEKNKKKILALSQ